MCIVKKILAGAAGGLVGSAMANHGIPGPIGAVASELRGKKKPTSAAPARGVRRVAPDGGIAPRSMFETQ